VPSNTSPLRSAVASFRALPGLRHQVLAARREYDQLVQQSRRDSQALAELTVRVSHAENQIAGILESIERMHQTLVEADPHMAYDIVTAVRDDVRALLVEVTEQANRRPEASAADLAPQG
jgi:hypothetical protein